MSAKHISLALGLALSAAVPAAHAADWNYGAGGIKDRRAAGIPVPAPVPVMEHFRWYLRADAGLGVMSGGTAAEQGMIFGARDATGLGAQVPFGTSSSWFQSDFDTFASAGVGVGLYLTPRLRGDVTVDTRTKSNVIGSGSYSYDQWAHNIPVPGPTGVRVNGTLFDKTEVRGTSGLLNLYYDLTDRGHGFTPYIGAGVGFVVRSFQRTSTTTESLYDVTGPIPVFVSSRTTSGNGKAHPVAPAFALTAGASYSLHAGMVLDFNYRYMYLGEVESSMMINGAQSFLKVGETHEHALRAGVRVNVW
jgi:opacity protein-like surface antigen